MLDAEHPLGAGLHVGRPLRIWSAQITAGSAVAWLEPRP